MSTCRGHRVDKSKMQTTEDWSKTSPLNRVCNSNLTAFHIPFGTCLRSSYCTSGRSLPLLLKSAFRDHRAHSPILQQRPRSWSISLYHKRYIQSRSWRHLPWNMIRLDKEGSWPLLSFRGSIGKFLQDSLCSSAVSLIR
jgi:hypothetical protein